ncbi:MAG: ion channel [Actinomycetota bacterium]
MLDTPPTERRFYDRFELLFGVTAVTVVMLLLVDLGQKGGASDLLAIVVTLLTAATLVLAVVTAGIHRRGLIVALIGAGSLVVTSLAVTFTSRAEDTFGGLLWLLLVVAAPIIAMRRLNHHRRVTFETILGAVSVYLLMAIAATYLFLAIDSWMAGTGGFFGQPETTTTFMYFSLVTITTLGYGDLAPVPELARAVAVWEAVIGQVFLVIVVARLVSMYSRSFSPPFDPGPDSDD